MSDDEFVRRLRERVSGSVPVIPVETGSLVARARRRRAAARSVGALAAVVVVGGAVWGAAASWPGRTTNPGLGSAQPVASLSPVPSEQRAGLIGMWRVDAPGEGDGTFLKLAGSQQMQVWRDCGVIEGTWAVGPTRFVAAAYGWDETCMEQNGAAPTIAWLYSATGYRPDGDGWDLVDASGAVTATLRNDGLPSPRPNRIASDAQAPVADDAARYWVSDPAPLPAGMTAATAEQVAGRWTVSGAPVTTNPWVELAADGTWQGSDGCNGGGGRWAIDVDGQLVISALGATTDIGCDGAPLPDLMSTARWLVLMDGDLVLLDHEAQQVATLTWDGPAAAAPSRGETLEPSPGPQPTDTAAISCGPGGAASTPTGSLVATSAGVRLVVQNAGGPAGTYLNYVWGAGYGGGGQELPTQPTEWQLPIPPGTVDVWCSSDDGKTEWGRVTLTVTDPGGFWRATTIQALGCAGNTMLDMPMPENDHWVTPRQAVVAWFSMLNRPGTLTAEQAAIGYADASTQTWFILEDGAPYVSLTVTDPGGGYMASADVLCGA